MGVVYTRTHVYVEFANPYLVCWKCHLYVSHWHDNVRCGCDAPATNEPCGHDAGVISICPSWGPVDGCICIQVFGKRDH